MTPASKAKSTQDARLRLARVVLAAAVIGLALPAETWPSPSDVGFRVTSHFADWASRGGVNRWILRIAAPDGRVTEQTFPGGLNPSVSFENGGAWPDGIYIWELVSRSDAETRSDSGSFWVLSGSGIPNGFADGENLGMSRLAQPVVRPAIGEDQQIGDDLIVTGSACVGTSCANGEAFGSGDTLWLKQDVVSLKFDDTSTGVGMPANDWQLTANDPGSGGANKFSIQDLTAVKTPFTIIAGAPDNSLFVATDGKIGAGTATPGTELHIKGTLPEVRLEQASPAQIWDVQGDNTEFSVEDVTNSKTPFRIAANTPTSLLTLSSVGSVGISTTTPGAKLHLYGLAGGDVFAGIGPDPVNGPAMNYGYSGGSFGRGSGFFNVRPDALAVAPNPSLRFATGNAQRIIIDNEGYIGIGTNVSALNPTAPIHHTSGAQLTAGGIWTNASSRTHKHDIRPLGRAEAEAAFAKLEAIRFRYNEEPGEEYLGFIAEDVPELVATKGRSTLSPMDMVALLTKVVQDQQATMREQEARLRNLTLKVEKLSRRADLPKE